jgi:pyruvate formate lyase activating enzyme
MQQASFYVHEEDNTVRCTLCCHSCRIADGRRGLCGVRENRGGTLYSLVYGHPVAQHVDPVEKKPLFHFLPGSRTYSIATVGCNFRCLHCQNHHISQFPLVHPGEIPGEPTRPESIIEHAVTSGCRSLSYTYVEPTIFFEYSRDCAHLAREKGLLNVYVSNGFMSEACVEELGSWLDAINVDIKAYDETFYTQVCKARLQPVLENIRHLYNLGVWVELTTLVIPGLNDSRQQLEGIATFIADIDPSIPWHVTGFYPTYKMTDRSRTPLESLQRAFQIGEQAGLQYVYLGNSISEQENTACPKCGQVVVGRSGFQLNYNRLINSCCPDCGFHIPGIWG